MKFIHAADIHLDSPLRGLPDYSGAPLERIRDATRQALQNMVDLAIERAVDFVIIAGDLYDGDWPDFNTGLFFANQMSRLGKHGIDAFIIHGNHDAASRISKSLKLPTNVHVFDHKAAETKRLDALGVALHGQSFPNQHVDTNLVLDYPKPIAGCFNIGILHTSADGREGHGNYAPCSIADMLQKGYDYWALGHIHRRELLSDDPPILFSGNLQGRHIREHSDEGKGCTLVEIEEGRKARLEHRPVDTVRWRLILIDISSAGDIDAVYDLVRSALEQALGLCDGRLMAGRVKLTGESELHAQLTNMRDDLMAQIRALANDVGQGEIWIEKLKLDTRSPVSIEKLAAREDTLGDIAKELAKAAQDRDLIAALKQELKPMIDKLPPDDALAEFRGFSADESMISSLCAQASELLLAELARGDPASNDDVS